MCATVSVAVTIVAIEAAGDSTPAGGAGRPSRNGGYVREGGSLGEGPGAVQVLFVASV